MNKVYKLIGGLMLLAMGLNSCSNTRYLKSGELLYVGADIKIEDDSLSKSQKKELKSSLEELVRPKPNAKILGLRPKLYFYNLAGEPKKEKGIRHWMRNKLGEAPVLFGKVDLEYNESIMSNYAENQGYFNTIVSSDTVVKNKKVEAVYTVKTKNAFLIRNITFVSDSTALQNEILKMKRRSLLKKGQAFNLDVVKNERVRIDSRLKEKGYYFFNPDYLIVQIDSTIGKNQVDLFVKVKETAPTLAKSPYTIDQVVVFTDYSLNESNVEKSSWDTIKPYNDFIIVDPNQRFRPQIYDRTLYFKKGDLYNRTNHNLTLNRLVNLGTFKFVKNQFTVADSAKHTLNSFYYLTPEEPKSIRLELLGKTNSASYTGSEINVNWRNRNFFKGAELFTVSAYGGMDFQMSSTNKGYDVYKFGTEANLIWPRIISPFKFHSASGFVPRTKATLGYEYQNRTKLYALHSFKGSFGYLWKEDIKKEHELNIIDINYVSPEKVSELYLQEIEGNASLQRVLDKQLIFGPKYTYTYTNTMQKFKKNTIYYKGVLDLSANLTGLLMKANEEEGEQKSILGVPFSQYVKVENDFRYYRRLTKNSQLATRVVAGIGIPYGNSDQMPYIKQFFVGGTNSIRAFRSRTLGPGSFNPTLNTSGGFVPDQSGDITLELNVEYRAKLFSIVHGALFVDAGNIWLLHDDADKPGGKISKDFYKEMAVGAGFGLRFDISFLVVRTDLAFPIRVPYLPEGDRWTLDKVDFGDSRWRKDNLIFNLAIGYPF
ncbi:BamA/TamA family outer membrane protein [Flavobacterium sp. HSC-61S13]|uniref:translocation and assembly module lipoprotein TamL n=1 Tax=Flavobacterium sp. HSC-61S13 TaxID=2910963 RepID=UPI00209CD9DF|nr:BamA/TamA family outer membrane protein [Flavobacterium sp. HSC-61S13]MCP1995583.1 outer membrane protein assembly factor BamA [Flavobacterium sp. HSC-61S13]